MTSFHKKETGKIKLIYSDLSFQKQSSGGVLQKMCFQIFRENSQENTSTRVSFLIKLQASGLHFIRKKTLAQVLSCEFFKSSENVFFYRTPLVAVSVFLNIWKILSDKRFFKKDKNTLTITTQSMFCYDSYAPFCQATIKVLIISVGKLY